MPQLPLTSTTPMSVEARNENRRFALIMWLLIADTVLIVSVVLILIIKSFK